MPSRFVHRVARPLRILRDEGVRSFTARVFAKLAQLARPTAVSGPSMLVGREDASSVDWSVDPSWRQTALVVNGPAEIAWISSPPGPESGGHQNLFRFIKFAEQAGHRCHIYLYDQFGHSLDDVRSMLRANSAYPDLDARISDYDPSVGVAPGTQAIFASGWETAYPSFRDASTARRFYFVQDFEPTFYPVGSESLLAENTYRFGFYGITAGRWLASKLAAEYGMTTSHFDFSVDPSLYRFENDGRRDEVFFYARPVTPRRAFEFGILALEQLARQRPGTIINLAGWNVTGWPIPFAHRNLGSLDVSQLSEVYNRCAAGLVLSLTNMSLLPLELMACGTAPVINDAPNNRLVSDNPYLEYVPASPHAIARRLIEVLEREDAPRRARAMAESVSGRTWEDSGRQFLQAFESAMRG